MNNLAINTEKKLEWLRFKTLKENASKCHLILSPYQSVPVNITVSIVESSNFEKLLGIYVGSNFSLEYHINRIFCKAIQELHAFSRIAKYISEDKKR